MGSATRSSTFAPHIIAIAGGSCSGKTRLSDHTHQALNEEAQINASLQTGRLGSDVCTLFRQDNYYRDEYYQDHLGLNLADDPLPNFDHPDAIDWERLREDLQALKSGCDIDIPVYDFTTHRRTETTIPMSPHPIILIEGILLLAQAEIRDLFDQSFFVDCVQDVRLDRRLKRDIKERGRTEQSVRDQFSRHVAPMHERFVQPSKKYADKIITQDLCGLKTIIKTGPLIQYCRHVL